MSQADIKKKKTEEFTLLEQYSAPEIYADGVSQVLIGYPMTKITFHTVLETGPNEIRKACLTLAMDTPSAVEFAIGILDACKNGEKDIFRIGLAMDARLKTLLEKIPLKDEEKLFEKKEELPKIASPKAAPVKTKRG